MKKISGYILITALFFTLFILTGCSKEEYTVSFDSNGGTSIEAQQVKEGQTVKKPESPEKEGFCFIEWQLNDAPFDFETKISSDLTLKAFYEPEEGTRIIYVAFDPGDGSPAEVVEISKGAKVFEPLTPVRHGYIFKGWYLEDKKFDFSDSIKDNLALTAKWEKDPEFKDTDSNSSEGSSSSSDPHADGTSSESASDSMISYADVKGTWYAEGTDDVTLKIYIYDSVFIMVDGNKFDKNKGTINYSGGSGGTEYYQNGKFYAPYISLEGKSKLIFSKNGNKTTFYRKANYPEHIDSPHEALVKKIAGYYWYLDGSSYGYIRPYIDRSNANHPKLIWDAYLLGLKNNKIISFEDSTGEEYYYGDGLNCQSALSNILLTDISSSYYLIDKFNMKVSGSKLYITTGGKQYSFTRHSNEKEVSGTLSLDKTSVSLDVGEKFTAKVKVTPYFADRNISMDISDENIIRHVSGYAGNLSVNGESSLSFVAQNPGRATITFTDLVSQQNKCIEVNVKSVKVTGISLNKTSLSLQKGKSETLYATVRPSNATNKKVSWVSSNSGIVSVTPGGKISAVNLGTATITAITNDGKYRASCKVTVTQKPFKVTGSVGQFWGPSVTGISAEVTATGGSEKYVEYSIKVYYEGTLIGQTSKNILLLECRVLRGTYTAEVYARDSDGHEAYDTSTFTIG